jgi:citrate lyase subunit beta/citryl-CoA lyase
VARTRLMPMGMPMMRSWMFVPGHRQRMIEKALGLRLDVAILDLEDGVPPAEKEAAREGIAAALGRPPEGPARFARVHPAGSAALEPDLEAVARPGLAGLVLPKVEGPDDVRRVAAGLEARESRAGLPPGSVLLVAMIESAIGLLQAPAIAAASPRLIGLMFGAEDFAMDLGLFDARPAEAEELLYARSAVVVAAASARLQAIDRVYPGIGDAEGLRRDTLHARRLGFTGKALIHPGQIEVVHDAFRPTADEVAYARRVVEAFDAGEAAGVGAVAVEGRMVDRPIVERARRVLAWEQRGEERGESH